MDTYHIAGDNRFRFSAYAEYPAKLKSIFSSTIIRKTTAGIKMNRNTLTVTQLKKHTDIPPLAMIMSA
jgi:hypothetical protein